eukprot:681293-Pyramimonas_sp.AAC.1
MPAAWVGRAPGALAPAAPAAAPRHGLLRLALSAPAAALAGALSLARLVSDEVSLAILLETPFIGSCDSRR